MIRSNPVKALQKAGKPAFGTWITLCPHPRVVKILAAAGFDFVLSRWSTPIFRLRLLGCFLMLARETGLIPIVRPPGTLKPHDLTRPLDSGAQGCSYLPLKRRDSSPTS